MISSEITRALSGIPQGTHIILLYDSPERKREILFSHLAMGAKDSKVAYVCSEETPDKIEEEMREFGMNVKQLKASGRLTILDHDKVYMNGDKVDVPQAIGHLSYLAWSCSKENLDGGLRLAEEMSCFVRLKRLNDLTFYENRLHRTFFFPVTGICAYSVTELQATGQLQTLLALLHSRDRLILTGPKGISVLEPVQARNPSEKTITAA